MPEIENDSRYIMPNIFKFQKGDDPDQWLQMYQDASQVGSLGTNEMKLCMVLRYLDKTVRKWFYNQEFQLWSEFIEEFTSRFQNRKKNQKCNKKVKKYCQKEKRRLKQFP